MEPVCFMPNSVSPNHSSMLSINIEYNSILKLIDNLQLSLSAGNNNINSKILENTKYITSEILTAIFNQSLPTSTVHLHC